MRIKLFVLGLTTLLLLARSARAQNYTITLYDGQNGSGNAILVYNGPMLTPTTNWTQVGGFAVFNPAPLSWTTPPIAADLQPGVLNPCNAAIGNGNPNGEAGITCESGVNSNGLPLFSFCFLGAQWPMTAGTYNVDSASQPSCGNYFFANSQLSGYSSYAFLNNGSIVVVKNKTWTVTSLADDGSVGTLRDAIANANSGDTINFAVQGTITLTQGQLEISRFLTISGPGAANLTISGNNVSRVLQIDSGAAATISGLTVEQGAGGINGRGILNNGSLSASNCAVLVNTYNSNNAEGNGGGLYNAGTATITNCSFVGSVEFGVAGDGGGMYNVGTATITGSTFSNFGISGGGAGLVNRMGTMTVMNSTFWGNSSVAGAAILNQSVLSISNSTFAQNNGGSSIYNLNTNTTVKNSLFSNPGAGNCYVNGGSFVSGGYNLSDDGSCAAYLNQVGDRNNTPAGLDPAGLKNNGGPTQTVAILPTSPAFNVIPLSPANYCAAADGTPIKIDQRGVARPQVSACDIGAFEYSTDDDSALAQLSGGNNFTGNQAVNGTMTATSFVGNGSGLTNIAASGITCTACIGNTQLGVSYAAGVSQGGDALNAMKLGGQPANFFATLGPNTFSGGQSMPMLSVADTVFARTVTAPFGVFGNVFSNGAVTIGSGTPILKHLSATFSATFPGLKPGTCSVLTFTLSGASDGDTVALGVPNAMMTAGGTPLYTAWVSAANTITIRTCNIDPSVNQKVGASGAIRVDIWKH